MIWNKLKKSAKILYHLLGLKLLRNVFINLNQLELLILQLLQPLIFLFTLGQNIGLDLKFFRQPRQINQRRPADHFRNRIIYLLHFAL